MTLGLSHLLRYIYMHIYLQCFMSNIIHWNRFLKIANQYLMVSCFPTIEQGMSWHWVFEISKQKIWIAGLGQLLRKKHWTYAMPKYLDHFHLSCHCTAQKIKFSIKDFFSIYLLKKSLMGNFIFRQCCL